MKLINTICFVVISVGAINAQEIDERLLVKYSQTELELLVTNNPDEYAMLEYALDNALYVANYSKAKGHSFETIAVDH